MSPRLLVALLCLLALAACKPATPPADSTAATPADKAVADGDPVTAPPVDTAAVEEPVGKPEVPSLQVTTIDGSAYNLADRRGKWVVVNFWATWCAPCLKEMPELSALDTMREHIEVIGLAYEEIEPEAMRSFLEKHPVSYPIAILDVYSPPQDFATPRGLPMTYLIAPDGKVARQFLGPVTAKDIEAVIDSAQVVAGGA
jgi:thiol-disulfide isomerase/thioredoxin